MSEYLQWGKAAFTAAEEKAAELTGGLETEKMTMVKRVIFGLASVGLGTDAEVVEALRTAAAIAEEGNRVQTEENARFEGGLNESE